jgi:molybdate transport system substrate-binding protein
LGLVAGLGAVAAMVLPAMAATVPVAVAANFTGTAKQLAQAFEAATGNRLQLSFGSSGTLYAQISQGAPFEIFLSADTERPKKAVSDGLGVSGTEFIYAVGKLVLYSPSLDLADGAKILEAGSFAHLAVADARTAPYGAAAVETIEALGLKDALQRKLVIGENISQTLAFVESGNAELGFVALSQVMGAPGSQWVVPPNLYQPIEQGAVLLAPGRTDPAAQAFLAFLKSGQAAAIIEKAGYGMAQ